MTANKDQKSIIRERMNKTGESYMAARRHVVEGGQASASHTGSTDWSTIRGLLRRLSELMADLDNKAAFTTAPKPNCGWEPEEGSPCLSEEWKMGLVSTVGLLAEHLHLRSAEILIHPSWADFNWATPQTINENPYVQKARRLITVARKLLAALDSN